MRQIKNWLGCICLVLVGSAACYASPVDNPTLDRQVVLEKIDGVYTSQIGMRELTGHNDGVMVEQYLAVTGFPKGNAWCAAFISWTFERAASELKVAIKTPKSAWSPSWFPPGKVIYTKSVVTVPLKVLPQRADVFGIYFPKLNRIGHVGFIDEWPPHDNYAITVEGNTNNAGSREGDGVYRKRRLKENIYKVSRWV